MAIEAIGISKAFGTFEALKNVSLTVPSGKLVALLGPSGSGKTTLLRIIAGLEQADAGEITLDGQDASDTSARKRGVGFVFQHYALFRHMSVFENVAFGLRVKPRALRPSNTEIRDRVMALLTMVQIDWLADRLPSQLSGGQRQRAALARALAVEPKVLLLDEPFGALDAKVRKELRRWLRRLHDEIHVTSIFVTHDVEEALEVSDEVVVMNAGRIEQHGTPDEVYSHPVNAFVYHFLGSVNIFHNRISDGQVALGDDALIYARPHDIEISRERQDHTWMEASILHVHAIGPLVRIELKTSGDQRIVEAELTRERYGQQRLKAGETVFIRPRQTKLYPGAASGPRHIQEEASP